MNAWRDSEADSAVRTCLGRVLDVPPNVPPHVAHLQVYPTTTRSFANSMADGWGRLGAFAAPFAICEWCHYIFLPVGLRAS